MSQRPLLTCLCLTYGRVQCLREALACFLLQDCDLAELLIWNFSPIPLALAEPYPRVTLLNEPHQYDNIEGWLAGLDRVATPYVRDWVDDDLYLPWAVSQALAHIGHAPAVMDRRRYHYCRHVPTFRYYEDHTDGGGLTMRTDVALACGITDDDRIEVPPGTVMLPPCPATPPSWVLTETDPDGWLRKSSTLPRTLDRAVRNLVWRSRQTDHGARPLTPRSVRHHFRILRDFCPDAAARLAAYC